MKSIFFKNIFKIFFFIISTNSFSQIVINELMVRPPGTVSTPPNGLIYTNSEEYIELYNNSCSSINISGYFIAMKQNLSTINTGGTFKIPNIPAANILPGGHVVIGSASPAGSALGNIDIPITAADRCLYNGNFVLANTDGWCALYNASGVALDCVYWSSSASNLTSNTSDFNPPGGICLPAGSPVVTLQTPFQINSTLPSIVKYGGPNPSVGSPLSRQTDGANNWVQNLASSIGANNCNGGITVAPGVSPSAPTVVSPVNYCQGATATALIATPATGGVLNWYGTNATGGTATSTSPIPSTTTAPTTVIYYVSQTVGGCESPRAQIVVNVNSGGNLGLFCDTANSTATSLAFDFSNVGQTNFSYSYSINGGTPITGTHVSPSNFTVSSLTPGSSVTFTLSANGVSCVSPQTVTCSTIPVDCGSCSTPNCPILGVANYGVKNFPAVSCSNWSPALTNTVVKSYYLVQADSNGFVGLIQQANGSPPLCINRSAILRPLATSCNVASNVSPSVVNANGVASGFNPEWYGLIPNAQYIIEVTITLGVGCTLDSLCSNYYGCSVPSAPTATATIQPNCTTPTGTIVVSSPSGVGNLYSIDGVNFQASSTFSGLVPNTYSVIVKKTPSGCTSSATNITINALPSIVTPTFNPVAAICSGGTLPALPTTSNNGITGVWSPALNNTATTTYTFTPTVGQCASSTTLAITVNSNVTPTFNPVAAICSGSTLSALPTTSNNGITGVWSPALNNTATTTYTFTPIAGQCATSTTLAITVNSIVTPTFNPVAAICSGSTLSALPTTSNNGITGVWSPALNNTATTTYTFTPTAGQCAISTTLAITVNSIVTPTFNPVAAICSGSTLSALPTTSTNGITGVWSPALNNTATTTYTFTPTAGQCAISTTLAITVTPKPILTYTVTNLICNGSTLDFVLNSNLPGTTYTWSASNNGLTGFIASGDQTNINQLVQLIDPMLTTGSISMIILPISSNGCVGDPVSVTILVKPNPRIISITQEDATLCSGETLHMDVTGEPSGLTYNWTVYSNNGVIITSGVNSGTTTGAIDLQLTTANPMQQGQIQFQITPIRNGCSGTPVLSDVIIVNPIPGNPIGLPQPAICSGETTNINVSENLLIPNTQLQWQVVASDNVTGYTNGIGLAPISINDILVNSSNVQGFVTYRITSVLGECGGGFTDITVLVNPLPKPVLTDGYICVNATTGLTYQGYLLDTQLSDPSFTYDWFLLDTTTNTYEPIAGANASTYLAMVEGNYQVIVTNSITNCYDDASADVIEVFPATAFTATVTEAFTDNPTITITVNPIGTGSLIYALDDGAWQESNVFTGVEAGTHTVLVSDLEGCTNLSIEVIVIDYPKYFTPNGDGIHDTWNIIGLNQADAKLYIFDRYGKLIKQISVTDESKGWDGTYNGAQLPSTDYWFTLDFTENKQQKQFKSHFSLKR